MAYRPKKAKAHQSYHNAAGKRLPGVTTIVGQRDKGGLISWVIRLIKEGYDYYAYMDDVSAVGTCGHELISALLEDRPPEVRDFTKAQIDTATVCLDAFSSWVEGQDLKLIWTERQMVSEELQVGGTPDIYCKLNGYNTLLDIKTSDSGLKLDNFVQVAAYALMIEENGEDIEQIGVVRCGKDGSPAEVMLLDWEGAASLKLVQFFMQLRRQYTDVYDLKKLLDVKY